MIMKEFNKNEYIQDLHLNTNSNDYLYNIVIEFKDKKDRYDIINKKDLKKLERIYKENDIEYNIETKLQKFENNIVENLENKILAKFENNLLQNKNIEDTTKNENIEKENNDVIENFDEYFNKYIEHRKNFDNISDSSIKGYNASMRYLKYFINKDTQFTFKFFKDLQLKFTKLPKNFFKYDRYYKKTFTELMKIKEKEKYETLNNKTINNHINSYKLFFKYLKYDEIIDINNLADIQQLPEEQFTNKEEYTQNELELIFKSEFDDFNYINMCKVSLYCGFRIEEVLSIKKIDIKDNFIHINLKDTSSKNHTRIVPIHKNLLDLINYQIKHNKGIYLFFNGNVDNEVKNVGKRLNNRLKTIISDTSKTFHSFRKNFSQEIELNTDAEEATKKYLMGHSMSKDITHSIYNRGKFNNKKLIDCINQITFKF